jgi:hypothetical protein
LDKDSGKVREKTELPSSQTLISPEAWEVMFDEKILLEDVRIDGFSSCAEYKINNNYNLYLMDGEVWLGILDLGSAKDGDFIAVIKLKLEDESTDNVETLKIGYKLLQSVSRSLIWSKERYCQDVEYEVGNYSQDFDGKHISASFDISLSWRYEGYDNPYSFYYGKAAAELYSIKPRPTEWEII